MTTRWTVILTVVIALSADLYAQEAGGYLERFLPSDGNNIYQEKGLLRTWPKEGPAELWRIHIGYGKCAIVESHGRIYTATEQEKKQYAVCLDALTGKTIWQKLLLPKGNSHVVKGPVNSPLLDGDYVYLFPYDCLNGDLWEPRCPCFCLRAADGSEVWKEDKAFNVSEGSTALIVGDVLYVGGGGRDCALAAVDKLTGKLRWKVEEDRDTGSKHVFGTGASLVQQVVEGIPQIIVSVYKNDLVGVHAGSGKIMWHWPITNSTASGMVPTPVVVGQKVFISASQMGVAYSMCFEMAAHDGTIVPKLLYEDKRLQCNAYHTPSIIEGAVFGFGRGQEHDAMQCTSLSDGKLLWQEETPDWNRERQLTIADGLIFAITRKDDVVLLEASRTGYKELGRFNPGIKLGIPQQPMIVGGRLFIRGDDTLVCYQIAGQ